MAILSTGIRHDTMPEGYIRARLLEVATEEIPLIDLGSDDGSQIIRQICEACRSYGFFLIMNHGITEESMQKIMGIALEFFPTPVEEKMKYYSDDPSKKMRLSTSFNVRKETVHNWRDYLRLHDCHPLEEFVPEWPSTPPSFKDVVSTCCREVRGLIFQLLEGISESLDLEKYYLETVLGDKGQHMAVNFYLLSLEQELSYGLPGLTDPNTITILLQDQQLAGLHMFKDCKWIIINPHPNALVVNMGNQIQVLINKVWNRDVINSYKERISIAPFLCLANDVVIRPGKLNDESRAIYRNFTYDEYYEKFWSRNLDDRTFPAAFHSISLHERCYMIDARSHGSTVRVVCF